MQTNSRGVRLQNITFQRSNENIMAGKVKLQDQTTVKWITGTRRIAVFVSGMQIPLLNSQ